MDYTELMSLACRRLEELCRQKCRQNNGEDVHFLFKTNGEDNYLFLYDNESRVECLRTLGRYACNPELSFTWYDASVLSQRVRQEKQKKNLEERFTLCNRIKGI